MLIFLYYRAGSSRIVEIYKDKEVIRRDVINKNNYIISDYKRNITANFDINFIKDFCKKRFYIKRQIRIKIIYTGKSYILRLIIYRLKPKTIKNKFDFSSSQLERIGFYDLNGKRIFSTKCNSLLKY